MLLMTGVQAVHRCLFSLARQREWPSSAPALNQALSRCVWGLPFLVGPSTNKDRCTYAHLWIDNGREVESRPGASETTLSLVYQDCAEAHICDAGQEMPVHQPVGSMLQIKCATPCVKDTMTDTKAMLSACSRDLGTPPCKQSWRPLSSSPLQPQQNIHLHLTHLQRTTTELPLDKCWWGEKFKDG